MEIFCVIIWLSINSLKGPREAACPYYAEGHRNERGRKVVKKGKGFPGGNDQNGFERLARRWYLHLVWSQLCLLMYSTEENLPSSLLIFSLSHLPATDSDPAASTKCILVLSAALCVEEAWESKKKNISVCAHLHRALWRLRFRLNRSPSNSHPPPTPHLL